jgi:hypothetical protein
VGAELRFLVPLVHAAGSSDETIETHQQRTHPLQAAELVLSLSQQLGHVSRRARDQLHDLPEQCHGLGELLRSDEHVSLMSVEYDADEEMPL